MSAGGSQRFVLLRNAVGVVLDEIEKLPFSEAGEALRAKAVELASEIDGWADAPPSKERREAATKQVLGLHVAVSKARIRASSAPPSRR